MGTTTKLSLYNNALLLVGERPLSSDTEDVETRHRLDTVYDQDAADYCLDLVKPRFALHTDKLDSPTNSTEHGLLNVYDLPSDYVSFHSLYADQELDQPIRRYILEQRTIACDFKPIRLRYIRNSRPLTDWTPGFANVMSAYLAKQIAPRFAPQKLKALEELFMGRVESTVQIEGVKEPERRSTAPTATLTNEWRKIYNMALFMLGLDEIVSNDDDSDRRSKLDVALGTGVVETVLEDVGWKFGVQSDQMTYDPSLEPEWGFTRVFKKPSKMHRLQGLFQDEYFHWPLEYYEDEGDYWYCDLDEIYVKYTSTDFLTTPSSWPQYFANLVAAYLACLVGPALDGANVKNAEFQKEKLNSEARSTDAMSGPPQKIHSGSWVRSRGGGRRGQPYGTGRP